MTALTGKVPLLNPATGKIPAKYLPAGGGGGGEQSIAAVEVVTGAEDRPEAPVVFWIGGNTQPANMDPADVWFKAPPGPDITAPSAPTGVTITNLTATGFTVSWTVSTDDVGVTGYDVFLNGEFKASTAGLTLNATGLLPDTLYSVTVRAKDAAANLSAFSTPVETTTLVTPIGPEMYSVWGAAPFPVTLSKAVEAQPITVATAFYSTLSAGTNWRSRGMRIWVPAGVTVPASATCTLWEAPTNPLDLSGTPLRTATMTEIAAGQWNEVEWDTPYTFTRGAPFYCAYNFGNGDYLHGTGLSGSFILSTETANFVLAEHLMSGSFERNRFRIGTGSTASSMEGHGYGIDALIDKGA